MNMHHERAMRAIAGGARTPNQLRTATSSVAWPAMQDALAELIGSGYVTRGRGSVLSLTASGRALIAPPPPPPMKPYVPPKQVVARPGARDWERIPSVMAGREAGK